MKALVNFSDFIKNVRNSCYLLSVRHRVNPHCSSLQYLYVTALKLKLGDSSTLYPVPRTVRDIEDT